MCTLDACLSQKKWFLDHMEHCLFDSSYNGCTLNSLYCLPPHENPEILHQLGLILESESCPEFGTCSVGSNNTRETQHAQQEKEFHFIRQYAKYHSTVSILTLYKVILHILYELIEIDHQTTLILPKHTRKIIDEILKKGIGLCSHYLNTSWSYLMGYSRRYFLIYFLQHLNYCETHKHTTVQFNTTSENFGIGNKFYNLFHLVDNWVLHKTNDISLNYHSHEQKARNIQETNKPVIQPGLLTTNKKYVKNDFKDCTNQSLQEKQGIFLSLVTVEDIQRVLHDFFPKTSNEENKIILTKTLESQHEEDKYVREHHETKKTFMENECIEGETEQFLYESVQAMISIAQRYGTLLNKDNKVLDAAAVSTQSYFFKTRDAVNNLKILTWGNQLGFITEIVLFLASIVLFCVILPFIFSTITLA